MNAVKTMKQETELRVKLFGQVELENCRGRSVETMTRDPAPWLMLKYLLLSPKKSASLDELYRTVWEKDESAVKEGTLSVRLFRAREILAPLGLDGTDGLLLRDGNDFWLNPDCAVSSDVDLFLDLMEQHKALSSEDPRGLDLCVRALELYDAPLCQFTGPSPWLAEVRNTLQVEYQSLAWDALNRSARLGDSRALDLLAARAPVLIPPDSEFHSAFLRRLEEKGMLIEQVSYQLLLDQAPRETAPDARPAADRRVSRRKAPARPRRPAAPRPRVVGRSPAEL